MRPSLLLWVVIPLIVGACSSDETNGGGGFNPTPSPIATIAVSGTTVDYFSAAPVGSVFVETLPANVSATSSSGGAFSLTVPAQFDFSLVTSGVGTHRTTIGEVLPIGSVSIPALEAPIVATADVARQYTSLSVAPTAGRSAVFLEIRDSAGDPLETIALAAIALLELEGEPPLTGVSGPFFFGSGGDLVGAVTLTESTAFGGRARAGFLNVPSETGVRIVVSGTTIDEEAVTPLDGVLLRRLQ